MKVKFPFNHNSFKSAFCYVALISWLSVTGCANTKNEAHTSGNNTATAQVNSVENHTFLNVNKIAKHSKAEVDAYLGDAVGHNVINPSNTPCPCDNYVYKAGNIEITFMKDKADWITINKMSSIDFDAKAILDAFGLKYVEPQVIHDNVMKWNDTNGFDQLSVFGEDGGKANYAFLKAITH